MPFCWTSSTVFYTFVPYSLALLLTVETHPTWSQSRVHQNEKTFFFSFPRSKYHWGHSLFPLDNCFAFSRVFLQWSGVSNNYLSHLDYSGLHRNWQRKMRFVMILLSRPTLLVCESNVRGQLRGKCNSWAQTKTTWIYYRFIIAML